MTDNSGGRDETPSTPGDDGPVATFENVLRLLKRWQSDKIDNQSAPGHLQRFLNQGLNSETDHILNRDIVERRRGSNPADVMVNGEIAVTLISEVRQSTIEEVTVALSLLADRYNFIVIYWLDPSSRSIDYRRTIERRWSGSRLGVRRLDFVTGEGVDDKTEPVSGRLLGPSALGGAALIGLVLFGIGFLSWALTNLTGPSRLLLIGLAGFFVGGLALGTMFAVQ